MRHWITFQWPPYRDLRRRYPLRLWLDDTERDERQRFALGDTIFVYQLATGPSIVAENGRALPKIVRCEVGRQGITAICRLKEPVAQHRDFPRRRYQDGREMWWCWYADLEVLTDGGFIGRSDVSSILGYGPKFTFRGLTVKELTGAEARALRAAYSD